MDKAERERIGKLNALRFSNIDKIDLKKVVEAKQAHKQAVANLKAQKGDYSDEYFDEQMGKLNRDYAAKLAGAHQELSKTIDQIHASIQETQKDFVIDDTWTGTLQTLRLGGKSLDMDTIQKLNANFAHDQPRLRALQAIYKEQGIAYDGGIDKMIYNVDSLFNEARRAAEQTFSGVAGINSLASKIAKIANMEGFEFDASPDPDGFMEAAMQGAGLTAAE